LTDNYTNISFETSLSRGIRITNHIQTLRSDKVLFILITILLLSSLKAIISPQTSLQF